MIFGQKCLDFKLSGFGIVGTIALVIAKAQPFEIWITDVSRFQILTVVYFTSQVHSKFIEQHKTWFILEIETVAKPLEMKLSTSV